MRFEPGSERQIRRRCLWGTQPRAFAAATFQYPSQRPENLETQPPAAVFPKPSKEVGVRWTIAFWPIATHPHPSDQGGPQPYAGTGWIQPVMLGATHRISPGMSQRSTNVPKPISTRDFLAARIKKPNRSSPAWPTRGWSGTRPRIPSACPKRSSRHHWNQQIGAPQPR